ncbi:hypothetical protein DL89DRAFT_255300 [Linderina pennispora]|uniref:Uncharacterized protein n=1 Tax=Linderina pennispora TaxID=61395 RepID=A0A1Y1WI45_9FUNG|nr:uncharacterized protein DL89DRAFT_255300 [Linderina pennispora]ORX73173.1 hypothetical protein DL89DRAFT_255300 [Linderina pennispora]
MASGGLTSLPLSLLGSLLCTDLLALVADAGLDFVRDSDDGGGVCPVSHVEVDRVAKVVVEGNVRHFWVFGLVVVDWVKWRKGFGDEIKRKGSAWRIGLEPFK